MEIIIPGAPVANARPRFSRASNFMYDPQAAKKRAAKAIVRDQWRSLFVEPPVTLQIEFHMAIPKSMSKRKQNALVGTDHCGHQDVDNLMKFCMDVMTGIVYEDDCHVSRVTARKIWALEPKTVIRIT